jgi:hypothetical protein
MFPALDNVLVMYSIEPSKSLLKIMINSKNLYLLIDLALCEIAIIVLRFPFLIILLYLSSSIHWVEQLVYGIKNSNHNHDGENVED